MVARAVLGLAALVCAGWLALSYRSAHLEQQAIGLAIEPRLSDRDTSVALEKLHQARAWQPDAGPELAEWALLLRSGRKYRAQLILRRVVRSEPENSEAWGDALRGAPDPGFRREAQRRLRELQPPSTGPQ
jgi:hypothetical protein